MVEDRVDQGAWHGWPLKSLAWHMHPADWIATTDPSPARCLIQQFRSCSTAVAAHDVSEKLSSSCTIQVLRQFAYREKLH